MMNLTKFTLGTLKSLQTEGVQEISYYAHSNPLVRWIFWRRLETVAKLVPSVDEDSKVLDFGAGSGILTFNLAKNFKKIHAFDLKTESLHFIKKKYNLENVSVDKAEGFKLPYDDNYFDLIFAADVLEHMHDSTETQNEFRRVLKKGGCLIVSVPTENWIYDVARKAMAWHQKPVDHYSDAKTVIGVSRKIFNVEKIITLPVRAIPGFKVYRAKKEDDGKKEFFG